MLYTQSHYYDMVKTIKSLFTSGIISDKQVFKISDHLKKKLILDNERFDSERWDKEINKIVIVQW
jgi:hypothetical protein